MGTGSRLRAWYRLPLCLVLAGILASCSSAAPSSARVAPSKVPPVATSAPNDSGAHVDPPTPTDTPFMPATPPPSETPPAPSEIPPQDYFGSHEEPPEGVEPTLNFFIPMDNPCRNRVDQAGPEVRPRGETLELPARALICLLGFNADNQIEVSIASPGGNAVTESVEPDQEGVGTWEFVLFPSNVEGRYDVTAVQGDLAASSAFDVSLPSGPRGLAVPEEIRHGESADIWFAGLKPSTSTPAYLYMASQGKWRFDAILPQVATDEVGAGFLTLVATGESPAGSYMVLADGRAFLKVVP